MWYGILARGIKEHSFYFLRTKKPSRMVTHPGQHTPNHTYFDIRERPGESECIMAKLNMFGDMPIVPENAGKVKDFEALKRAFETAYTSGADCGPALMDLSTAIAYSVVNKCIDPQRKTAAERDSISDNGINPAMLDLKRGIAKDRRTLDNTREAANKATMATFDKDGDTVTEVADKDANDAVNALIQETLSDGIDLVQDAAVALLAQAEKHAYGTNWLDRPYTTNRLSKKVYIHLDDSAAYREDETTPIQEVYREVRRSIQNSRAVQTDPRNGYTYIEDTTPDGLDAILYRMDKYADIGGTDCNGLYTGSRATADNIAHILDKLDLTTRQEKIIRLRMQGMGHKAIATYLGVSNGNVYTVLKRIREKCEKIGFTPDMWKEMTEKVKEEKDGNKKDN